MANDKIKPSTFTSCAVCLLWLTLVQPIWYALLFGILTRIDSPPWMWVCYWIYVPAGIVVKLVADTGTILIKNNE